MNVRQMTRPVTVEERKTQYRQGQFDIIYFVKMYFGKVTPPELKDQRVRNRILEYLQQHMQWDEYEFIVMLWGSEEGYDTTRTPPDQIWYMDDMYWREVERLAEIILNLIEGEFADFYIYRKLRTNTVNLTNEAFCNFVTAACATWGIELASGWKPQAMDGCDRREYIKEVIAIINRQHPGRYDTMSQVIAQKIDPNRIITEDFDTVYMFDKKPTANEVDICVYQTLKKANDYGVWIDAVLSTSKHALQDMTRLYVRNLALKGMRYNDDIGILSYILTL